MALWTKHEYYYPQGLMIDPVLAGDIVKKVVAETEKPEESLFTNPGGIVRSATIYWLHQSIETRPIFDAVNTAIQEWNKDFEFELHPDGPNSFQVSRYLPGQKYEYHMDIGKGNPSLRKVSVVIGLNNLDEYEGGGLQFFYGDAENIGCPILDLPAGEGVIFPAYVMHRAVTVTKGVRWTLAGWYSGAYPFS